MHKKLLAACLGLFTCFLSAQSNFTIHSSEEKITKEDLIEQLKQQNKLSVLDELKTLSSRLDKKGILHTLTQQFHNNISVEDAFFNFHSKNGILIASSESIRSLANFNTSPDINKEQAFDKALGFINAKKYIWEDSDWLDKIKDKTNSTLHSKPSPQLTYLKHKYEYKLSYKLEVLALEPHARYIIYIDASDGKLLRMVDILNHVIGDCDTNYHGNQDIDFDEINTGEYQLTDASRNIETYLLPDNSIDYSLATLPTSIFLDWNDISHQEALDVQWSSQVVHDFLDVNGIQGYDGLNASIISYVNYGNNTSSKNNAFWNGSFLTYGSGGGNSFPGPVVTLDVIAHEIGHAVTENYGNGLLYFGESGAINESYSDIIAASVESFVNNSNDYNNITLNEWLMSDLNGNGIRDLSNPNANNKPDTYGGEFWADTSIGYDNGGVHINSGIGNFWFYLLSNGGTGTNDSGFNYSIDGIGIDLALEIVLDAYNYLNYTSGFQDWRNATEFVAGLSYDCSIVQEVINAWESVGVGSYDESCSLIAEIDEMEVTQFCTNTEVEFSGSVGFEGVSQWSIDGIVQLTNLLTFTNEGFHMVALTNTYPSGDTATDKIRIYATECVPIQSYKNTWYFGNSEGFDFSSGIAEKSSYPFGTTESTVIYSDDLGNVKFYIANVTGSSGSTGTFLIDPTDNSLVSDLFPINQSSVQLGAVVPHPQGDQLNVLMANGIGTSADGFYRLILDVSGESPSVISGISPVNFPNGYSQNNDGSIRLRESMVAIPSCNENIFWIVTNTASPSRTLIYKLDYTTNPLGDLTFEQAYSFSNFPVSINLSLEVSPNGNYISAQNKIFEFNRDFGTLTLLVDIPRLGSAYRYSCFSSDSRFLYIKDNFVIKQYDILNENIVETVADVYTVLSGGGNITDLKLGPDNKIYINHRLDVEGQNNPVKFIGVINKPNKKQVNNAVDFNPIAYRYAPGGIGYFVFPSFSEAEKVDVQPLDFSYGQDDCFAFSFDTSSCRPFYAWSFGDGNISNIQNPTHVYNNPGNYSVLLTSNVSGQNETLIKTISVGFDSSQLEIIGPSEVCEYDTVLNGPQDYANYQWLLPNGGGVINGQGNQSVHITWDSTGEKQLDLIVTDYNGCTATISKSITVLNEECDYNLDINEYDISPSFQLFPNPAKDKLEIVSNQIIYRLSVIDINGRVLYEIQLTNLDYSLDVSSLTKGIYFLEIQSGESKMTKKFIKN